eukprot:SAG11_NODE_4581_length_1844_cov_1.598281_2_plen_119_part_00
MTSANSAINARATAMRAGMDKRQDQEGEGQAAQAEWAAELPQKQAELEALLPQLAGLQTEHEAYEAAEAVRQEAHRTALAAARAAEPPPPPPSPPSRSAAGGVRATADACVSCCFLSS